MLTRTGAQRIPMSKEEFFRRTQDREECLQDWEDGMGIRLMTAHSRHGFFIAELYTCLKGQVPGGKVRIEVSVELGPRVPGPDLVVLYREHADRLVDGRVRGVPDIIVEVLSPDSVDRDRVDKFNFYYQQGVPWYWIGDAEGGVIEEFQWSDAGYVRTASGSRQELFKPRALPGVEIAVADLLED